jgi:F-type H+-transporting ATPase subunit b
MSLVSVMDASKNMLVSSGGGVDVDFDVTLVVQIVFFLLLLGVLKPTLFDPMLKLFEERERRIEGAKLLARKTDEASAGALSKYESEMQKARAGANVERDKLRAEGVKLENEILAKVRASTTKTLAEGRSAITEQVNAARASLKAEMAPLAKELAARVLGREVH